MSHDLVRDLRLLEPFGQGNPEPVFFNRNIRIDSVQTVGSDNKHLKIWVKNEISRIYPVVAFGRVNELNEWKSAMRKHLLVTVGENVWNGERSLQMQLVDSK